MKTLPKDSRLIPIQYLTLVTLMGEGNRKDFIQAHPYDWEILDADLVGAPMLLAMLDSKQVQEVSKPYEFLSYLGTTLMLDDTYGTNNGLALMFNDSTRQCLTLTISPRFGTIEDYQALKGLYQSEAELNRYLAPQVTPIHESVCTLIQQGKLSNLPSELLLTNVGQLVAF